MKLTIELKSSEVLPGEGIPIHFRLANGPKPLKLPALPDESSALVVELRALNGDLLASATGHDRMRRCGLGNQAAANMPTELLPPNETGELRFDLLEFLDPPGPGDYLVSLAVRFEETNLESDRQPLRILDRPICDADVLTGTVCVPCFHSAVTHQNGESNRAVVTTRSGINPKGVLARYLVEVPKGVSPRLSLADFNSSDDVEGDLTRWLAWLQGPSLCLVRLGADSPQGKLVKPLLPFTPTALVGRPIQHADGGVSVILCSDSGVQRIRCDAQGVVRSNETICGSLATLGRAALATRSGEALEIGFAAGTAFPITLVQCRAGSTRSAILKEPFGPADSKTLSLDVVNLQLFESTGPGEGGAICSALVSRSSPLVLWLLRAPYPPSLPEPSSGAVPTLRGELYKVEYNLAAPGESITAADTAQTTAVPSLSNDPFRLFAAIRTSTGRVLAGMVGCELQAFEQADASAPAPPRLMTAQDGSVYLVIATKAGDLELIRIHQPPVF